MLIAALGAAFALAGGAPALSVTPVQKAALRAVNQAAHAGRVDGPTAASARAQINRAAYLARTLPSGRREHLVVALREVASLQGVLTTPRTIVLTGELKTNSNYFAKHYAPAPQTDIADDDGVVYRYFAGRCFEYHPLANFGALNAHVSVNDAEGAARLADALVARGTRLRGGGMGWEYLFPFGGGRAPWLSGMAQAVAAQSLARTAALDVESSTSLAGAARAAYQAIPGKLLTSVSAGPWIRLYSFTSLRVLNAQLQAVVSLQSYAAVAEDEQAAALALRLQRAAAATIPSFDTGYWSYYALPHDPSPLDYHQYVVQLLKRLAPADSRFADAATRFARYEKEPPAFQLAPGSLGALTFWVSKPASISALTAAGPARRVSVSGGWHTLRWAQPKRPGIFPVRVSATDLAGNRTSFETLPFVRATATLTKAGAGRAASAARADALPQRFEVGTALDDVSQSSAALQAGISHLRIGVAWPPGAAAPDEGLLNALRQLAPGVSVMLELNATPPVDDAGRAALAQYAAVFAANVPGLASVVLGPAPTSATAPAYAAAFAAIRAALPGEPLGVALDGAVDPAGTAFALSGIDADLVAFRPAAAAAKGAWTLTDVTGLDAAFPDVPVVIDGAPAPFAATLRTAACNPRFVAVFFDRLSDVSRTGVKAAIGNARRGSFVCPGVAFDAQPLAVQFPAALTERVSVALDCDRDCLYLVTLDDAQGRPVVAKRGQLVGGVAGKPATVTLPQAKLSGGRVYTVDVRLVARVNPGRVTRVISPPLQR